MPKPLDMIRVRITGSTLVPDPAKIENAGSWYFLDHVSSGLAFYENEQRKFSPLFAESWSVQPDATHIFKIKSDIRFHDGTPITSKDILWSIKRLIILKTSSHFPLWDYIEGCDSLKTLNDECIGLTSSPENEIRIKLKTQNESFFLQLASPETGIWSAEDMDPRSLNLTPTKYSGAYFVDHVSEKATLLKRNEYSPISQAFPNSPRSIVLDPVSYKDLDKALTEKKIDFSINIYRPYAEPNWETAGLKTASTVPSEIIYLHGLGEIPAKKIGRDFLIELWNRNSDKVIHPADSFLPFNKSIGLSKDEYLVQLPPKTHGKLRILSLDSFIPQQFLEKLQEAARAASSEIEFTFVPSNEWYAAFSDRRAHERYDYILSVYAASERYPAVQLRYLTSTLAQPSIDLKSAESPDLSDNQRNVLKSYQKWLLNSQFAIPLFFNVTYYIYQPHINLGNQSKTDAEIELWRLTAASSE